MAHHHHTPTEVKRFSLSALQVFIFLAMAALGAIAFIKTLGVDQQRAWAAYLVGFYFWLCVSLSGVFFAALQHVTAAGWSVTVRRVSEVFIAYLPIAAVLFVVLLFGLHHLYEWTHHHVVDADPILSGKKAYLNVPFFIVRAVILFAVSLGIGGWMVRNSLKQDESGSVGLTLKNLKLSPFFIFFFAWGFTFFAGFDLMMSLVPHWFSTMFGVYCWAGLFYSGLAMITLIVIYLRRKGILDQWVTEDHLHDLGKLMFAFTVFWGYIGFSQFMLIWYGNLPEETFYYLDRLHGGWMCVTIVLLVMKFGLPFFMLISRFSKRSSGWLAFMGIWFLLAQWLDVYWMVYPTFYKQGPVFGISDVLIFLGFAGLFLLSVGFFLSKVSPVAVKDPRMSEALNHHQ